MILLQNFVCSIQIYRPIFISKRSESIIDNIVIISTSIALYTLTSLAGFKIGTSNQSFEDETAIFTLPCSKDYVIFSPIPFLASSTILFIKAVVIKYLAST